MLNEVLAMEFGFPFHWLGPVEYDGENPQKDLHHWSLSGLCAEFLVCSHDVYSSRVQIFFADCGYPKPNWHLG